jgi:hypothetical protein
MQRRHVVLALAAALFAAAGPWSDSGSRTGFHTPHGSSFRWVDEADVLHWADTGAGRPYALDALSLKYVRDYTQNEAIVSGIAGIYWCGTPVLTELQSGRLPRNELTATALRRRAQSLLERYSDAN